MITEAHIYTPQTRIKSEVHARTHQKHAVRCTIRHRNREDHILPRENRQDKNKNSTSKNRNSKLKEITNRKGKREENVPSQARKQYKARNHEGKHTRECAMFRRLQARTLHEGCRTEIRTKDKHTYSATENTWEAKKRL